MHAFHIYIVRAGTMLASFNDECTKSYYILCPTDCSIRELSDDIWDMWDHSMQYVWVPVNHSFYTPYKVFACYNYVF